jgi:hypothetical protein
VTKGVGASDVPASHPSQTSSTSTNSASSPKCDLRIKSATDDGGAAVVKQKLAVAVKKRCASLNSWSNTRRGFARVVPRRLPRTKRLATVEVSGW